MDNENKIIKTSKIKELGQNFSSILNDFGKKKTQKSEKKKKVS